jgi:eukaryotic-like serine/threonine-protein kinase
MDSAERPTVSHPNAPPAVPDAAPPVNDPAPPAADVDRSVSETTRFRVVSLHASGGMGNVFVAQDDQLHRSVALKEIQERFADDRQIRERFLREAEVTGQLEHPGIVPVYAMGHADDGRPYYVMRMIRGDSLRHAIGALHRLRETGDEHAYRLKLRRLLNRFVTACNTIEYAHSRGVVHRDIKPDNIMLGPYGETLVVDWGLAKVIGSPAVTTAVAGDDRVLHAPAQESFRRSPSDDSVPNSPAAERVRHTPTDATEFGTVTGTPAYMSPEQALGWQDAITPASDVYSLGATLYSLLTGRPPLGNEDLGNLLIRIQKQDFRKPREVNPSIPRPLEAICLKAMAPSASGRYPTAVALASDLEAFLAGEPVSAWREPLSVRATRWVRRHRTLVTSGAATALVLIVALGVIVLVQNSANRRLSEANDRETSARKDAEAQRDKAQQNFQMAQDAVDRYFTQVSEDHRLSAQGLEPLRRDLLISAGQFYERFVTSDSQQARLHYDSAWAKFRLASITEEIAPPAEAAAKFDAALQAFTELAKLEGGTAPHAREGLLMCQMNLCNLYDRIGQRDKGQSALVAALSAARSLVGEFSNAASAQHLLARCLGIQGRRAMEQGNLEEGRAAYIEEVKLREQIVKADSKQQTYQVELASNYRNLAIVAQRYERLDEARQWLDQSLVIDRKLAHNNVDDGFFQNTVAQTLTLSGDLAARDQRAADAQKAYREAVDLRSALIERHPDVLEYRAALATTADNLGVLCCDRGEYDASQTYFTRALGQAERLATDYPKLADYQSQFATILTNAAVLCTEQKRLPLAQKWLEQALSIRQKLERESPSGGSREKMGTTLLALAVAETDAKRLKLAEQHVRAALDVFRQLSTTQPDRPSYTEFLGVSSKQLGDVLKADGRDDPAVAAYHEAQDVHRRLVATHPNVLKHRLDLAGACVNLGNLCNRRGQAAPGSDAFVEVLKLFANAPPSAPLDPQAKALLEKAYTGRALARETLGDLDGMVADFEAALALVAPARARGLRLKIADIVSQSGEADRAIRLAEPLLKEKALDGPAAFDLAVVYARAAEQAQLQKLAVAEKDRGALAERRTAQAIELLQRASAGHYFADAANRQKLQAAPFVPLLSGNAAFRKLLQAIESERPASPPAAAAKR